MNSEGAATGIFLSGSLLVVKELLKHFNRRQKQVYFAVVGYLRAKQRLRLGLGI